MKKTFCALLVLLSLPTWACWSLQGSYAVDGQSWKFSNKVDHHQDYLFSTGPYHIKIRLEPGEIKKSLTVTYEIHERKADKLILVTKGEEEEVIPSRQTEIFAKGEAGQPNTILTLRLRNI